MSDTKSSEDLAAAAGVFESEKKGAEAVEAGIERPITGYQYVAPPAPGYDVHGLWHYFPCHGRTGYAAHAIALHSLLIDELKVPTSLVPHRNAAIDIDKFPRDRFDMLLGWMKHICGHPEAFIVSLPPELKMYEQTRALVNYVAFEATKVSEFAAQNVCNDEKLAALWCVSEFTARAFLSSGVDSKKVFVVRPPICDGPWKAMFTPLDELERTQHGSTFQFGTVGTWHERKGFRDLVRAYFREFKRSEPVELAIRTSHLGDELTIKKFRDKVVDEIAAVAREFGDDDYPRSKKMPVIRILLGTDLSDAELIKWLGSIDCYVNPSYGEGLGIPAMWAAAQGLPIVSSEFGAVGEWLLSSQVARSMMFPARQVLVPTSMMSLNSAFAVDSLWGGYDVGDAAVAMRVAYADRHGPDREGAEYTRNYFSYRACAPSARSALAFVSRSETLAKWGIAP